MSDAGPPPPGGNPMFRPHDGTNPYARPTVPPPPVVPKRSREARGRIPASLVLAIVLVIAGGAGFFLVKRSQPAGPGPTVSAFIRDAYEGDAKAVCGALAESNLERFEEGGTTCTDAMNGVFADIDREDPDPSDPTSLFPTDATAAPKVVIDEVTIDGDRAEVEATIDGEPTSDAIVVVKEDGDWKLDLDAAGRCRTLERTMETASAAFEAQYGEPPLDAEALLDENLIREVSPDVKVTNGTVTMQGACA